MKYEYGFSYSNIMLIVDDPAIRKGAEQIYEKHIDGIISPDVLEAFSEGYLWLEGIDWWIKLPESMMNEVTDSDSPFTHLFFCPGCKMAHGIVKGRWKFNENLIKPTISPSILVRWVMTDPITHLKVKDMVCHSYVENGNIRYLNDCTHELKGKTIPLPFI